VHREVRSRLNLHYSDGVVCCQSVKVELNWADAGFRKETSFTVRFRRVAASESKLVDLEVQPLFNWVLVLLQHVPEDGVITGT
jgi:hypothetical protein